MGFIFNISQRNKNFTYWSSFLKLGSCYQKSASHKLFQKFKSLKGINFVSFKFFRFFATNSVFIFRFISVRYSFPIFDWLFWSFNQLAGLYFLLHGVKEGIVFLVDSNLKKNVPILQFIFFSTSLVNSSDIAYQLWSSQGSLHVGCIWLCLTFVLGSAWWRPSI